MHPIVYFSHSGTTNFSYVSAWLDDRVRFPNAFNVRFYHHTEAKVFVNEPSTVSFRVIPHRRRLDEGVPHLFKQFENVIGSIAYLPFDECENFYSYADSTLQIKVETIEESILFRFRMKVWRNAYLECARIPYFDRSYAELVKKRELDPSQWMITRPEPELQLAPFVYPPKP